MGASDECGSCLLHHFVFRRLSIWFSHLDRVGVSATDSFFDCAAMQRVEKNARQFGRRFYIHRCLQHVKANVKEESSRRDHVSGKARLQNRELVGPLVEWLEFSAAHLTRSGRTFFGEWQGRHCILVSRVWRHTCRSISLILPGHWSRLRGVLVSELCRKYSCYAANTIESGHKSLSGSFYFRCLKLAKCD